MSSRRERQLSEDLTMRANRPRRSQEHFGRVPRCIKESGLRPARVVHLAVPKNES